MKRNCVFVGFIVLCLCVVALRLYSGNLSSFIGGKSIAYDGLDREYEPILIATSYERVDLDGGEREAQDIIKDMSACVIKTERVGEIDIYYCYSPRLIKKAYVFGAEVNLMIAVSKNGVSVGTPLLKGSF